MLRRRMHKVRAGFRIHGGFPKKRKSMHRLPSRIRERIRGGGGRIMISAAVWTGAALWLVLNVAFVALRVYVTRPTRIAQPVLAGARPDGGDASALSA
jgi:hypothetical protein